MFRLVFVALGLLALMAPAHAQQAQLYCRQVDGAAFVPVQPGQPCPMAVVPSSSSSVGIAQVTSASAEASHVLKATPGNLYNAYAVNLTSTAGFLVLLDATSAPADGAIVPIACAVLPASGSAAISYIGGAPQVFATGITAVVTSATTCFTKTTGVITAFISGGVK